MSIDDEDEDLSKLDRGDDLEADDDKKDDEKDKDGKEGDDAGEEDDGEGADDTDEGAEDADEAEEDEDGADEDEDGESDEAKAKNIPIRLKKAKEKAAKAEARAAELQAEIEKLKQAAPAKEKQDDPEPDPADAINQALDKLYEQAEEARADGDTKLAAKLQRDIDKHNRELATLEAKKLASQSAAAVSEEARFDAMVGVMESSIDALNPEHEDFDPAEVKALERLVAVYEKAGATPTQALREAVRDRFRVDPFARKKGSAPEKGKDEKKDDKKVVPIGKKKTDLAKNVDAAKRQPPSAAAKGANKDDQTIDVANLSDEDFEKLPEATKARYRGDSM